MRDNFPLFLLYVILALTIGTVECFEHERKNLATVLLVIDLILVITATVYHSINGGMNEVGTLRKYTGSEMMKDKLFIPRLHDNFSIIGQLYPKDYDYNVEINDSTTRWVILEKNEFENWDECLIDEPIEILATGKTSLFKI